MVICFDATPEGKRALDFLLQTGQFKDTSEAVSVALATYATICQAHAEGGQSAVESLLGRPRRKAPEESSSNSKQIREPLKEGTNYTPRIPEIFTLNISDANGLTLQPIVESTGADRRDLPPAKWLFGQYNKFLPVKAACRALLNLSREKPTGVPLREALETISYAAWELGDYLYAQDQLAKRSREDALAAAFPTTAGSGTASRIRFANQFIGDLRQPKQTENQPREVKFNGFPSALKFIACSDDKEPVLRLTASGAEFAIFENPVLDGGRDPVPRKFSDAEADFLLAHISRSVPEECSAYFAVGDAIEEGANTPDDVDKYLCRKFHLQIAIKAVAESEITQTFLTTQRSGAISRMVDLGLVAREKNGLHVNYKITPLGQRFRSETP